MNEEERSLIARNTAALERLNGVLGDLNRRQDYSNLLLLRVVLALGVEPPEAVKFLLELIPESKVLQAIAVPMGRPISKLDQQTTALLTYVDIVVWEIPAGHTGELVEVWMATTDYGKTQFRLVLANEEQWTNKYLVSAFTQRFKGNRLTENMKVIIQAKSSDGIEQTVYGSISGKLIPPLLIRPQPEREVSLDTSRVV